MYMLTRILLVAVLALVGCAASEQDERLDNTFQFTVHALREIGRDPMAAASYQSAIGAGANPVDYVVIGMPEHAKFVPILWQGPATPWSVVIKRGPGDNDLVVEGYAAETGKPAKSETVDLAAKQK